jgi:hypothetical protein
LRRNDIETPRPRIDCGKRRKHHFLPQAPRVPSIHCTRSAQIHVCDAAERDRALCAPAGDAAVDRWVRFVDVGAGAPIATLARGLGYSPVPRNHAQRLRIHQSVGSEEQVDEELVAADFDALLSTYEGESPRQARGGSG